MRRRRRSRTISPQMIIVAVIVILICSSSLFVVMSSGKETVSSNDLDIRSLITRFLPTGKSVLVSGMPGLGQMSEASPVVITKAAVPGEFLRNAVLFFANVDIHDMRSWFQIEIPFLAIVKNGYPAVSAAAVPNFPKFDYTNNVLNAQPLVGIYHTHTAESFLPSAGVTHRPGGQRGEIVEVGEALAKRLESRGIRAVQSKAIHDYPSFMKAYSPSETTAKTMLSENPSLQMIFDIHRDADKRENSIIEIAGTTVARITFIVARGQPDLLQPHWQQNHAFAKLLDARLNQYYPGISRGIQLVDWRYNQHLHPRALLIEVGCQENSKEEATGSIELLGDIIAEIIAENKN